MQVACENCGKKVTKSPRQIRIHVRHFCGRECHVEFKITHPHTYQTKETDVTSLRKIKRLAELRKQKVEKNSNLLTKPKLI